MIDLPDCYRPVEEPPPEGWILAHNNVRPRVGRRKGGLGFRAFWVPWEAKWEVCHCGWRPDLGKHHREREEIIMRAAVYLRGSTAEQSTDNQERKLRAAAARMGHEVVEVYRAYGIRGASAGGLTRAV